MPSSPALVAATSGAILHHESGSTSTNLKNPTSYAGAVGPGQIMPATAKPYMRPGESLSNPADNVAIHNRIMQDYATRWPNDPARWAVAYFSGPGNVAPPGSPTPWIRNSSDGHNTVAQYVANTAGKIGAATPNTGAATTAPAAAQPANVGMALAALSAPTGGPGTKSTMDNLQSTFAGGGGDSAPPPMNLEGQQAAASMGNARQAQIAALAPQLMMATRQMGGLQGARGAPNLGSTMSYQGGQTMPMATAAPTPGTTLNSTGALYG